MRSPTAATTATGSSLISSMCPRARSRSSAERSALTTRGASEVLMTETMELVDGLLDGRIAPSAGRSPFFALPFFRTDFWPMAVTATAGIALGVVAGLTLNARSRTRRDGGRSDRRA